MAEHLVKSYDEQLSILTNTIAKMGALAEKQIKDATEALLTNDQEFVDEIVGKDDRIDELEKNIEAQVVDLITMRQPMAIDLRETVSAMKISGDLERIGDLAVSVKLPDNIKKTIGAASEKVQKNLKLVLDAFVNRDAKVAEMVWNSDEEIDNLIDISMNSVTEFMEKEKNYIKPAAHLLFMSKNLERMGDHATNIAETVYYLVTGDDIEGDRPKGQSDILSGQ
ncbi:MAG: phosphate transport system regulatory protein PhoU [Pelagibacteraceae bacterium]|nr:phosphate transport system regulatory protein PhoU [Pelagibacteraceae bacterium]